MAGVARAKQRRRVPLRRGPPLDSEEGLTQRRVQEDPNEYMYSIGGWVVLVMIATGWLAMAKASSAVK